MRIIDADSLREEVGSWGMNDYEPSDFIDAIDATPTVEPEKVLVANVTFDEDKLKEIVNSEVIEKIRNKMFFVREEDSAQPIAVIKVADLMKHNGGENNEKST